MWICNKVIQEKESKLRKRIRIECILRDAKENNLEVSKKLKHGMYNFVSQFRKKILFRTEIRQNLIIFRFLFLVFLTLVSLTLNLPFQKFVWLLEHFNTEPFLNIFLLGKKCFVSVYFFSVEAAQSSKILVKKFTHFGYLFNSETESTAPVRNTLCMNKHNFYKLNSDCGHMRSLCGALSCFEALCLLLRRYVLNWVGPYTFSNFGISSA